MLFQSLGVKCVKALPPSVDFDIVAIIKSTELCVLKQRDRRLVKFK